jgi:uncharacterized protein YecE (DUF72 family)
VSEDTARIRVGAAGWAYEDWNGIVYPSRPPRGFDRLATMASLFDTSEVNSTFYRIPSPRMTEAWVRRVEHNPQFAFTAKLFRGFTHEREAGESQRLEFLAAMAPLAGAGRLGCVLVQFPMAFHDTALNRRYLEKTLDTLASLSLAVEFRHASWNTLESRELLARHGAAFVNIDQPVLSGNLPPTEHVTSSIGYFRFHGRNALKWFGPDTSNEERYNYLYSERELDPWARRIREAAQIVSSFARASKKEPGVVPRVASAKAGVYAILNNHFRGQAVANALELQHILTGETRSAPDTLRDQYPALRSSTRGDPAVHQKSLF